MIFGRLRQTIVFRSIKFPSLMKNLRKTRSFWTLNIWTTFFCWPIDGTVTSMASPCSADDVNPVLRSGPGTLQKMGGSGYLKKNPSKNFSGKSNGQSTSWGEWWKIPLAGLELSDILIDPEVWNLLQVPKISVISSGYCSFTRWKGNGFSVILHVRFF